MYIISCIRILSGLYIFKVSFVYYIMYFQFLCYSFIEGKGGIFFCEYLYFQGRLKRIQEIYLLFNDSREIIV